MVCFNGQHELVLDDKNRLLIPASVRRKVNPEVDGKLFFAILKRTQHGLIPWLFPENFFLDLMKQYAPPVLAPTKEQLRFRHRILSLAEELEWDAQGRVLLPEKILRPAGLEKGMEITLTGAYEHLEIWSRARWNTYRDSDLMGSDNNEGFDDLLDGLTGQSGSGKTN
jgi:MraZ protein